jgi:hypothetical protein
MTPRILIVTRSSYHKPLLRELAGFPTSVTADAMTAIANAKDKRRRFDLLILDAGREDSFEALDYAREIGWRPRAVFVSSIDTIPLRIKAGLAEGDAFVLVPEEMGDLALIVKSQLE